ncbi:MAG: hypothetical protein EBU90_17915 [Proteobacteria bacterium]|jgi:hypothetical protein|nr:hypothetical protein [Pseudomonadota bacterium]NBP56168.1 hypothetical protein [Candidatus Elulimicrobium humile]
MTTSYYFWFVAFAIIAYFIATDTSVVIAINLIVKLTGIWFQRLKWMLLNDPRNPVIKYLMWRRALKLAKEFEKEFTK